MPGKEEAEDGWFQILSRWNINQQLSRSCETRETIAGGVLDCWNYYSTTGCCETSGSRDVRERDTDKSRSSARHDDPHVSRTVRSGTIQDSIVEWPFHPYISLFSFMAIELFTLTRVGFLAIELFATRVLTSQYIFLSSTVVVSSRLDLVFSLSLVFSHKTRLYLWTKVWIIKLGIVGQ